MNLAQRTAIRTAINNVEDNLARAEMQKKAKPSWVSGDGKTIDEVIASYKKHLAELKEDL